MNILHVTLGFYPATAWGGPVKIVHQNGMELAQRGHSVTVYCTNLLDKRRVIAPGTFERTVDRMRVVYFHTWRLAAWPGTLGPIWLPDLPGYLAREMRSFDVVHLNGYRNLMLVPVARAARAARVPFVIQPHGAIPIIVNSHTVKRLYDRWLGAQELDGVAAVIALQESERQQALSLGIPPERVEVIPNGLPATGGLEEGPGPAPGSFRRRFDLPADRPLILFLGRINRKKGADMLIEALAIMHRSDAHLAIVGPDDGQLHEVRALVEQHGLGGRVAFTGLLEGTEVEAAYRDSDLFVLPCRADTFPTTVLEACRAGTPMVITDRCEMAGMVASRAADVTPFDAAAFAAAMDRLLDDRERHARYRANCPALMAELFSLGASVDRLEALYKRAVGV